MFILRRQNRQFYFLYRNKMTRINPSFEIDKKGRSICQFHSEYLHFIDPDKDFFDELQLEHLLTCKTCEHYQHDECYFTKEMIDKIDKKRKRMLLNPYRCRLCGSKIHIMLTVINKIYQEKTISNLELPLICCGCYESIKVKEFKRHLLKRISSSIEVIILFAFFLLFSWLVITWTDSAFLMILPFSISIALSMFVLVRMRTIYFALKGWNYYNKFFKTSTK